MSSIALSLLGESVSTAGDINGDGLSDILIGAPGYDNDQMGEGRAWVYYGFSAQLRERQESSLVIAPAWVGEGNLAFAYFGLAVACAGDVNGDGFSDLLIGATGFTNGESGEGRTFMFYGGGGDGIDRRPRQMRTDDSAAPGNEQLTHELRVHPAKNRRTQLFHGADCRGIIQRSQASAGEHRRTVRPARGPRFPPV